MVNGQSFPKGATFEIPAGFLHRDPEHWPDPDKFIPERSEKLLGLIEVSCYKIADRLYDLIVPDFLDSHQRPRPVVTHLCTYLSGPVPATVWE